MRVFFALWPDAATRRGLEAWARQLRAPCGGSPTRSDNLHLTLAFVGDIDEPKLPGLRAVAARVPVKPFKLTLDTAGYWRHNRIVWAGATQAPVALLKLATELREQLDLAQLPFDRQVFVPHVTLLRKAAAPPAMPQLEPVTWMSDGFALVKSLPSPGGVRYAVDADWR